MNNVDKQRIRYILNHYDTIIKTIKVFGFNKLKKDELRFKGLQLDIIQIGEHIANLPKRIKQYLVIKDVNRIVDLRNELVHEYNKVNAEDIEDAINIAIPNVVNQLKKLIERNYYDS